jgi:ankyrin repeat protein
MRILYKKNIVIGVITLLLIVLTGCSGERPSTFNGDKNNDQQNEVKKNNQNSVESLMDAISNGDSKKVNELLSKDADPNKKDDLGNTPLIISVQYGELEITKLLVEAGADPNIQDDLGITPLAMAIENDNKEIVELLKEHGAK